MNPKLHAAKIASRLTTDLHAKYERGQAEHKTQLWTGGASWAAQQIREESVDLVAYTDLLQQSLAFAVTAIEAALVMDEPHRTHIIRQAHAALTSIPQTEDAK